MIKLKFGMSNDQECVHFWCHFRCRNNLMLGQGWHLDKKTFKADILFEVDSWLLGIGRHIRCIYFI